MDIQYLGHSSFRLKGKTAALVTDPFSNDIGLKFPAVTADIVTISHSHADHSEEKAVKEVKRVISGPGEYEIMDVSVIGLQSFHDDKQGELRGKNTIYVIEMDDVRFAHLGDLGHKITEKDLDRMGEIDVLFIPVGGYYTMSPEIAVEVAQSIEAKITIPMHFQTSGLKKDMFSDLVGPDEFITKLGLPVEKDTKLRVTRDLVQTEEKVVLLEAK